MALVHATAQRDASAEGRLLPDWSYSHRSADLVCKEQYPCRRQDQLHCLHEVLHIGNASQPSLFDRSFATLVLAEAMQRHSRSSWSIGTQALQLHKAICNKQKGFQRLAAIPLVQRALGCSLAACYASRDPRTGSRIQTGRTHTTSPLMSCTLRNPAGQVPAKMAE